MKSRRTPQYFSERSQVLQLEGALQSLAIFLGLSAFAITGFLMLLEWRGSGGQFQSRSSVLLGALGAVTFLNSAIFILMLRCRRTWQKIEREAGLDRTTGVMNRIHFEKLLEEELRRGGRYRYPITLCYLDVDDFSGYNDRLTRERGDAALKQFAEALQSTVRYADCVARYQNDEFCVLLPHTDMVRAEKFMSRLAGFMQERVSGLDFSAGVASFQPGESKAQFVMRAFAALAQAKREGKKKIRYAAAFESLETGRG